MDLKAAIRTIPDYPKTGILFRDVSTLLGDSQAFGAAIDRMIALAEPRRVDKVAGIDARGFILGGALAHGLGAGFLPLRKPGKLPFDTWEERYELEYGSDALHMHVDGAGPGERVLLVDDLIATGGTAMAGLCLLQRARAEVVGALFLVDLPDLGGAQRLRETGVPVEALVQFEGH